MLKKSRKKKRTDLAILALAALLGAGASFCFMILGAPEITLKEFPFDDAWIHLVYVRGWIEDGIPTYNRNVPEVGFSSPLWLVAATPAYLLSKLSLPLVVLTKLTGTLFGASAALGGALMTLKITKSVSASLLTILLLYLWPSFSFSAVSGMEVTLTATCLVWAVYLLLCQRYWTSGLLLALASLSRPESAAALIAVLSIEWIWNPKRDAAKHTLRLSLPSIVLGAVWMGYNTRVSGYPLPNTFYVKAGFDLFQNLRYVAPRIWMGDTPAISLLQTLFLVVGLVRLIPHTPRSMPMKRALLTILAVAGLGLLAVFFTRPVFKYITFFQQRYYTPYAFLLLPVLGVFLTNKALVPLTPRLRQAAVLLTIVVGAVSMLQTRAIYEAHCMEIYTLHTRPALMIKENTPRNAVLAVEGAGAMRFHSDRVVVDLLGLNHHGIAHADDAKFLCILSHANPTVIAVPTPWTRQMADIFSLRPVAEFDVEHSHFSPHRGPRSLSVFAASIRPKVIAHCRKEIPK